MKKTTTLWIAIGILAITNAISIGIALHQPDEIEARKISIIDESGSEMIRLENLNNSGRIIFPTASHHSISLWASDNFATIAIMDGQGNLTQIDGTTITLTDENYYTTITSPEIIRDKN